MVDWWVSGVLKGRQALEGWEEIWQDDTEHSKVHTLFGNSALLSDSNIILTNNFTPPAPLTVHIVSCQPGEDGVPQAVPIVAVGQLAPLPQPVGGPARPAGRSGRSRGACWGRQRSAVSWALEQQFVGGQEHAQPAHGLQKGGWEVGMGGWRWEG